MELCNAQLVPIVVNRVVETLEYGSVYPGARLDKLLDAMVQQGSSGAYRCERDCDYIVCPKRQLNGLITDSRLQLTMELLETFEIIRPSIVALGSKLDLVGGYPFPTIIGTGFVVDERGIILTNRHVAEALQVLPRDSEVGEETAVAFIFSEVRAENGEHVLRVNRVRIKAYNLITRFSTTGPFYGEALPDLAFLQLDVKGLHPLQIANEPNILRVGMAVATAGFPFGTNALLLNNKVVQLTPLLRHGIVSSLYPFPCPNPHGFTVDIMIQGGASGSPIFLPHEPVIVGMLYGGIGEQFEIEGRRVQLDSNVTLALPGKLLSEALLQAMADIEQLDLSQTPTLESLVENPSGGQLATFG